MLSGYDTSATHNQHCDYRSAAAHIDRKQVAAEPLTRNCGPPAKYLLYPVTVEHDTRLVFIKPQGPELTAEQAKVLDDDFFTSRPFELFAARITALLDSAEYAVEEPSTQLGQDFAAVLGLNNAPGPLTVGRAYRELQTALDALVVRHHVAEALVRLYWVLTAGRNSNTSNAQIWCTWAALSSSPLKNADVIAVTRERLRSEQGAEEFVGLVLPGPLSAETAAQVEVMGNWLLHAMRLLDRTDIDITAAHNKIKHGLAVRSRDDQRIDWIPGSFEHGKLPLSRATSPDALNLVGTVSVDYLSRPSGTPKQGLEFTTLNLPPAILLAEAWMMTLAYGAMFHVAATEYFAGRIDVELPGYPDVPIGPEPHQLLEGEVLGVRHPATTPPGGGEITRGFGIVFHERFLPMDIDYARAHSAVIVDG